MVELFVLSELKRFLLLEDWLLRILLKSGSEEIIIGFWLLISRLLSFAM